MRCIQIDAESAPSVSYLSILIESNGKRVPPEAVVEIIADIFQKDVRWFYGRIAG